MGAETSLFEPAADAIPSGDAGRLAKLLDNNPSLSRARSSRDHHSTLLHYVSASGVEDFRQRTPANDVESMLASGADVMHVNRDWFTGTPEIALANAIRSLALLKEQRGATAVAKRLWEEAKALYVRANVPPGIVEAAHIANFE